MGSSRGEEEAVSNAWTDCCVLQGDCTGEKTSQGVAMQRVLLRDRYGGKKAHSIAADKWTRASVHSNKRARLRH